MKRGVRPSLEKTTPTVNAYMSISTRKAVFAVLDQVEFKPAGAAI